MYLLFDIGGTNTRLTVAQHAEEIDELIKFPTPKDYNDAVAEILHRAKSLVGDKDITAGAAGVPAPIGRNTKLLHNPAHLPDWDNKDLAKDLEEGLGFRVHVANDSALAGLGEATYGAGKDFEIVAFIGIGTGIGGARIIRQNIDDTVAGFEPGHHIVAAGAEVGHWEGGASGAALKAKYGVDASEITDTQALSDLHFNLAVGLYNTILFWGPEVIVIGGGIGYSEVIKIKELTSLLEQLNSSRNRIYQLPELVKAELKDKAGIMGAMKFALDNTDNRHA